MALPQASRARTFGPRWVAGWERGTALFVGEDLAGLGDVLFDGFDLGGPVASGFIGVGNTGGVLTLGLGQMVEEDFEVLLRSGAGHRVILNRSNEGYVLTSDRPCRYELSRMRL